MKTFFQILFQNRYVRLAFAAILIVVGVAIGQFLNPIIDPSFNPALFGLKMYAGDYVSVGLPFLLLIGYSVFIWRLYSPGFIPN